jgi:hypothetical protein
MSRNKGAAVRAHQKEHVKAREALENRWSGVLESDESFADLVAGHQAKTEPYHRWLPFRQQFGPELVRRFLRDASPSGRILDPFSGSGTVVIACAQEGRRAVGVEAVPVLAWLTNARFDAQDEDTLASLVAVSRTVTGEGRRKAAEPLEELLEAARLMIAEDRVRPLPPVGAVTVGDARALPFADATFGGVVTSPPYLSRYDYSRITSLLDTTWRRGRSPSRTLQMRATLKSPARPKTALRSPADILPPAAEEAALAVKGQGRRRDGDMILAYFDDLLRTLGELFRVTGPGAPVWIVIGSADLAREYIPSDLIAAELALATGFEVEGILEARRLRTSTRFLGGLTDVSPRESVVKIRHPGNARQEETGRWNG